jgi:tetratricopeptide (TPR) repeat protein
MLKITTRVSLLFRAVFIGLFALITLNLEAQDAERSELKKWNNKSLSDSIRLAALDNYIWDNLFNINNDSAIYYSKIEYEFAVNRKLYFFAGNALNVIAICYESKGLFFDAIKQHEKALALRTAIKDSLGIAGSTNNLGRVYYSMGRYDMAASLYFKALRLRELLKDNKGIVTALGNVGAVYTQQKKHDLALNYYFKSLEIAESVNSKNGIGIALNNISITYKQLSDTANALVYQQKLLDYYKKNKNTTLYATALNTAGSLYTDLKQYDKADSLLNAALQIWINNKDSAKLAKSYFNLGILYHKKNKLDQSILYCETAYGIAEQLSQLDMQKDIGRYLANLYITRNMPEKAARLLIKLEVVQDSISNQKLGEKLLEEKMNYDFDHKVELSEKEHAQKLETVAFEAERDKLKRTMLIIGLGAILIVTLLLGFIYVRNIRQKKIIAEQKTELIKQKLLVTQINPHFIFNSLNAIQNYIYKENVFTAGDYLSRFARLMRMILNFSREDYIKVSEEVSFLESYLELQRLRFGNNFDYEISTSPDLDIDSAYIPPLLGQPFVENAVEHGMKHINPKRGIIRVYIYTESDKLIYEIEDNGPGLSETTSGSSTHKSLATKITRERLEAYTSAAAEYKIIIADKVQTGSNETGVLVKLSIPCKYN